MNKVIGIDISYKTFDVAYLKEDNKWLHRQFSNDVKGFRKFEQLLVPGDWLSMEASGAYYLPLASFFLQKNYKISVVNPLVIKRYSQAMLLRAKTDKKDARTIAEYTITHKPNLWKKDCDSGLKMRQILTALELISKQKSQTRNQLHAFTSGGVMLAELKKELNKILKTLEMQEKKLEQMLMKLAFQEYEATIKLLTSICGIGNKTAIALCVVTNEFKKFSNYKQVIAYLGLSPRIYQSGTSVNGTAHICKMGNKYVRTLLYLCTLSAARYNTGCKKMFDRLTAVGKKKRVVRIAVANKLVKQAFAVVHSGVIYSKTYDRNEIAA